MKCTSCTGRFVSVVPGEGDGVVDPAALEEVLPMPADAASLAAPPVHRISHQWGHVIGLGHTYERADRDRYARFAPTVWCGPGGPGVPPRCAYGPDEVGSPRIPSDTFGVYDEKSKMNAFAIDGVCGSAEPDANSGDPTPGDAAAVEELFYSQALGWAPFQPIGRPVAPGQPLDYQLAPGVDPTGSPAIAAWTSPGVEIFVRGTDGGIYTLHNQTSATVFQGWSDWQVVGIGADSDPTVVFADANTLHLAVRSADQSIRLRTRVGGVWGSWAPLGAPMGGAASAPTIAARDNRSLDVVVRGNDNLIHALACTDPGAMCAASAARSNAWTALVPVTSQRTPVGKPTAAYQPDGWLIVVTVASDGSGWLAGGYLGSFSGDMYWLPLTMDLDPVDPAPSIALQFHGTNTATWYDRIVFARDPRHALYMGNGSWFLYPPLGGVLASAPAAVWAPNGASRIDVAAIIDDHGHPGVWWKFFSGDGSYKPPCNVNKPGTCAQCGCNVAGAPACSQ